MPLTLEEPAFQDSVGAIDVLHGWIVAENPVRWEGRFGLPEPMIRSVADRSSDEIFH